MYQRVLAAIDFSRVTSRVCARASEMSKLFGARLTLLHVVEPIIVDPIYETMPAIPVELELKQIEKARKLIVDLGANYGISQEDCRVETGSTKASILQVSRDLSVDLIVIGSHGRRGMDFILGSTTSGVLHSAPCDVLAVRAAEDH